MSLTGSLAVYVIIWWLVLFMVLPIGAKQKIDDSSVADGHDAGAPAKPMMWRKILATTVISAAIFGLFYWVHAMGWLDFRPE